MRIKLVNILFWILFFSFVSFIFPIASSAVLSATNSTVTVEPASVPANGTSTAKITVKLLDDASTPGPVNNHRVEISLVGADSNLVINGSVKGTTSLAVTTGHDGNAANIATFTVKSNSVQTNKFNVKDLTQNVSLSQASVNFTSPTCGDAVPSAPVLSSATSLSPSQVKLVWTAVSDPFSYYVISYGLSSGSYIYGNPNVGKGTEYTVGFLSPGTTYYFAVKAINGCSAGGNSNELSIIAGQSATPTPIPPPTKSPTPILTEVPTPFPTTETSEEDNKQIVEEKITTPSQQPNPTQIPIPTTAPRSLIASMTTTTWVILVVVWGLVFGLGSVFFYFNFKKPKIKTIKISNKDEDLKNIDVK